MGGSSSEQTVGYKYYAGLHFWLSLGPIDRLTKIVVGDKTAWEGSKSTGQISINNPELFGGEGREGGIVGAVDFADGRPTQGQNGYLVSKLGSLVPAFRGVASVICRQVYLGLNPYPKKWEFWAQRIYKTGIDGSVMWRSDIAKIPVLMTFTQPQRIMFAIDVSNSMNTIVSGSTTRLDIVKTQLTDILTTLNDARNSSGVSVDLAICRWGSSSTTTSYFNASDSAFSAAISIVNSLSVSGGTYFTGPMTDATAFFGVSASSDVQHRLILITDGEPSSISDFENALAVGDSLINRTSTNKVDIYGINIDLADTTYTAQIDNTSSDGVPIVNSAYDDALYSAVLGTFSNVSALNFVHHIRETFTDPDWGAGFPLADIDAATWEAAAETAYNEGMGCCYFWDRQTSVDEYRKFLIKHIDAVTPVSRTTGKILFKLIRDDYDHDNIPTLSPNKIINIQPTQRQALGERTTSVTVTYWNAATGENAALTASNPALAIQQGQDINKSVTYDAFPSAALASRAGQRDLRTLSSDLQAFTIECWIDEIDAYYTSIGEEFNVGCVFRLTFPDFDLDSVIVRVSAMNFGDGTWKQGRARLECVQDAFALDDVAIVSGDGSLWTDPVSAPVAPVNQIAFEVPYIELVQQQGQQNIDAILNGEPDAGYFGVAVARPQSSMINARVFTSSDEFSGYTDVGVADFCPSFSLTADIGRFDTSIPVAEIDDADVMQLPARAQIGDELIFVTGYAAGALTVIRGVYDTIPQAHLTSATVFVWDNYTAGSETQYIYGETLYSKLCTVSGKGQLSLSQATTLQQTFESRASAPYRPANVAVNGDIANIGTISTVTPASMSWVDRNRILETTASPLAWTDAGITPETGTEYEIAYYGQDSAGILTEYASTALGYVNTYASIDALAAGTPPADAEMLVARLHTVIDGRRSWRGIDVLFEYCPIVSELAFVVFYEQDVVPTGTQEISAVSSVIFYEELHDSVFTSASTFVVFYE